MRLRRVLLTHEWVPFSERPGPLGRKIGKAAKGTVFKIHTAPCKAHRDPASKIRGNRWKPSGVGGSGWLWAAGPLHNFVHV